MSDRLTLLLLGISLVVAGTAQAQAQNELFPNTKEHGRAAIEYRDDAIQLVAAYYYSQRNHDSVWLLIEAGVSTEERMTVDRDAFRLITPDGEAPSHFTVAGADKVFHPATAQIVGSRVIVSCDDVKDPVAVRFAWSNTAEPNLKNKEGLPASPFRTDEWPGITIDTVRP
jgi:hypothetical protein